MCISFSVTDILYMYLYLILFWHLMFPQLVPFQNIPNTQHDQTYRYFFVIGIACVKVSAECQHCVCGVFPPILQSVALLCISVDFSAGVSKIILLKACH